MTRVKWAVASHRRRRRLLKQAKGNRGARGSHIRKAKETVLRAMAYSARDRKARKREFRNLWVIRLNAAARERGLTYNQLIAACSKAQVKLDRKQMAELAVTDSEAFDALVSQVTRKS